MMSCKSSFLDKYPLDQPSADNFWNTEDDLKLALTGCYAALSINQSQGVTEGFGAFTMYWDGLSDNAYPRSTSFNNIALGQLESTTGGIVNDWYNMNYKAIASCNYFLANADRVKIDATALAQYKAEVHFLRAYFYFQLTNIYGSIIVSLQPEPLQYAKDLKKSSREAVMDLVLKDLDTAITSLPDVAYAGRAVKASAQGLKARVLLYNSRFPEAAAAAKQVIDGAKFRLADEYYSLFVKPGQNNNPEIIFSARYLLPNMFSTLDYQMGWDQWERIQPIKNLVEAYECTDGKTISESPLYDTAHPYNNRDRRGATCRDHRIQLPAQWPRHGRAHRGPARGARDRGRRRHGRAYLLARPARHEHLRARGRRDPSHVFHLRAWARWALGHVPVAGPGAARTQRDRHLVEAPR
jgi:hypothetical protein